MQRTRKKATELVPADRFAVDDPFVRWYASYWRQGAARCAERLAKDGTVSGDVFMGELASRRFAVGVDGDKVPLLGVAEEDVDAVMSVRWASAAFLRRVQGRDWIALSCRDARISASASQSPIPLRMFLPSSIGLLDGWVGLSGDQPPTLRVVETQVARGAPRLKGGAPLAILPLSFKGAWEAETAGP